MKKILITGGAGFIGSNLALELQKRYPDAYIMVIDDFRSGTFKNLIGFRGDVCSEDISQIRTKHIWESLTKLSWDAIFHLASTTDTRDTDENKVLHDNVEGFRAAFSISLKCPSRPKVIYASSAATYGQTTKRTAIKETDPACPANAYGFSKCVLDNLARTFMNTIPIVGLRFFNVYGPNEGLKVQNKTASMVSQLLYSMKQDINPKVFKNGGQKRDFVYVKDVVAMLIESADKAPAGIYNCGSGQAVSFNELIKVLNNALGKSLETYYIDNPYKAFFQNFTQANMSKAEKAFGFVPAWNLKSGVEDYLKNFR